MHCHDGFLEHGVHYFLLEAKHQWTSIMANGWLRILEGYGQA